ncbi:hypothetical protein ATEIFO6365_0012032200 [Aspergillus terreus]|uniref:Uncharacterized protein n=1 Tax=Aspergillus terreus TaxID=33178 RepID=A0A5M3ZB93_ASPTE|nr:hypothetical protein ATETN484_0013033200 [Aspergillus terreus]GFF20566.1 hypothetical protein ATEIFO6365_0012032200 [Aspergillus terreus]
MSTTTTTAATTTFTSTLKVDESIVEDPAPEMDFIPNSGNVFPKLVDKFNKTAVEVWLFDAMAADGTTAFTVSFVRDILTAPAGFRIQINATFSDGTKWTSPLIFPESTITSEGPDLGHGRVVGVWRTDKDTSQAGFEVAADLSTSVVSFDVPGKITGTLKHRSLGYPGLPQTAREAQMAPEAYWMRPIPIADATVDMTFYTTNPDGETTSRRMVIDEDMRATGGVDRSWEPMPWSKVMTDSYFLRAKAGPYVIQVMRLVGRPEQNYELYATARLYRDGKLVCAPLRALPPNGAVDNPGSDDTVVVEKLFDGEGVLAIFRHKNVGCRVEFRSGGPGGERWVFEARHHRAWWSKPSSPPGPNATGHAGFVASVVGGQTGSAESHQGWGISGQVDMPE